MQWIIGNFDILALIKLAFFNWIMLIGTIIIFVLFIYFRLRWKIREVWIKKLNPKHVINSVFLNKENCITILPQIVMQQKSFDFQKEKYMVDKNSIVFKTQYKQTVKEIMANIRKQCEELHIPKNHVIIKEIDKIEKLEEYSLSIHGIFHTHNGSDFLNGKKEPYIFYVDGISTPILSKWLIENKGYKFDAESIFELANTHYLQQFIKETAMISKKMIIIAICIIIALGVVYFMNKPPTTP